MFCPVRLSNGYRLDRHSYSALCHLLREVMCRAASFKVRELICPCIALAADLDGTFAVARMQPVSRGAVQIAAVVAACPRGGFPFWPPRVCGGVGGPSLSACVCPRPAGAVPLVGADGAGWLAVGGVAVQIGGGSVIFGSFPVGLRRLCRVGTCLVRRPWRRIGACL